MILISMSGVLRDESVIVKSEQEKKKGRFGKWLIGHVRKITLLVLNFLFNYNCVFAAVGWFNKKRHFLNTVFLAFPEKEAYAYAYVYPSHRDWMRWSPWPCCIFRQDGKWGLMTVISSSGKDFINPVNDENLKLLVERVEKIRQLLGAERKTFAGDLPSILFRKRLVRDVIENEVTIEAIVKAENDLRNTLNYPDGTPLIILGGKGFVGKKLAKGFNGREIYCIDVGSSGPNHANYDDWPFHLKGKKAILINVSKKTALVDYIKLFWSNLVFINEVYPEPTRKELKGMIEKEVAAYHIAGLVAESFPKFPRAYEGGIPCCAGWNSGQMEVIVRELN